MKYGIRECCDVVMRAKATQHIGNKVFFKDEPVCYFDTLKTSSLEGSASTVYAQGGRGNPRLMSWDGERTLTFTMEDALISEEGLAILTGAGIVDISATDTAQHITEVVKIDTDGIAYESGTSGKITTLALKLTKPISTKDGATTVYAMKVDANNNPVSEPYILEKGADEKTTQLTTTIAGYEANDNDTTPLAAGSYMLVDYYTDITRGQVINIEADKFGGSYYLEASTLWRDENGADHPAEFIIPNCRVQSNFTFSMSGSGDPSTFTFTIDAFPGYTRFDQSTKVLAQIQVLDVDGDVDQSRTATPQA